MIPAFKNLTGQWRNSPVPAGSPKDKACAEAVVVTNDKSADRAR